MSAYNPPSQSQSIFNPNNYGTAISTLADSVYDEITATLGNFTTLFIGADNVATALNGKQDIINHATNLDGFNMTSGATLNFLSSGSASGDIIFFNPTNQLDAKQLNFAKLTTLEAKQDAITDGSLTIARTSGLQTALNGKQDIITNGSLTIARTSGLQTILDTIPRVYFATPSNFVPFVVEVATLNQTYFEYTFTGIELPSFDTNTEKLVLDLNGSLKQTFATTPDSTFLWVKFDIKSSLDNYSAVLDARNIYSNPITDGVSQEYSPIIRIFIEITDAVILSTITFRILASTTPSSTFVAVSGGGNPATLSIYKTEA
jgi:hypothetical protein